MASIPRARKSGTSARRRRDDLVRAFQREPDEGDRNTVELADFVGREQGLAGRFLECARGEIVEFCAQEGMRTPALVDRMAAAILHPEQFVLAFVELVVADGGDLKPHHRQRLDGRLVMEHCRQQRACADQVASGDEDGVRMPLAYLAHQGGHGFRAAGCDCDLLRRVGGISDPYAAGGGLQIAVEIVDRENPQFDRTCALGKGGRRGADEREENQRLTKHVYHGVILDEAGRRFYETLRLWLAPNLPERTSFPAPTIFA
jgi:hypothetical protein